MSSYKDKPDIPKVTTPGLEAGGAANNSGRAAAIEVVLRPLSVG